MADSDTSYTGQQVNGEPASDASFQSVYQHQMDPPVVHTHSEDVQPTSHKNTHRNLVAHNAGWHVDGRQDTLSDMDHVGIDPALEEHVQSQFTGRETPTSGTDQDPDNSADAMSFDNYNGNYDHGCFPRSEEASRLRGEASGDMPTGPEQTALMEPESPAPPMKAKKSKKRKRQPQLSEAQVGHPQPFISNKNNFHGYTKDGRSSHLQDVFDEHHEHHPFARDPAETNNTIFISSPQLQTSELSNTGRWSSHSPQTSAEKPSPAKYAHQNQVIYQQPQPFISKYLPRRLLGAPTTKPIDQPETPAMRSHAAHHSTQITSHRFAQAPTYAAPQRMPDGQPASEQPSTEQPSCGLDIAFEQLRRTIEHKTAQEVRQLTAEKQSLENQLQHAVSAKNALQDHVSSLRDEKERFAVSLEQEKAKFEDVKSRALQCKTFINALQGDMAKMKTDSDREHKQLQELLAATVTPAPDLTKHIEDSERLKNEVARQCRAASLKVSSAETRITHLEESLKEKIDSLAEEKNHRLQLQAHVNTIDGAKEAMLKHIKAEKDEVLDKLYEIHAVLEESNNREGVTNMLQSTMTAIQALVTQPRTTVDDIASVKSMMESLTDSLSNSAIDRQSDHDERLTALQSKINELEAELQSKIAEVTSLQEKLEAAPAAAAPVSDDQIEAIRRDAMAFQAQRQAEMENEMKKMRNRPSKEDFMNVKEQAADSKRLADSLQQDVDNLNKQVEHAKRVALTAENEKRELQTKLVAGASEEEFASIKKQRAEAQSLANRRLQEIEKLEQSVESGKREMATVQSTAESLQQKIQELNQQIADKQRIYEQRLASLPSAEDQASRQEQLSAAQELVRENQKTIEAINTQLEQEKKRCRSLQSTNERYKTSCDSTIAEEKERCEKSIKTLQNEVEQARNELQVHVAERDKFRADVDRRSKTEGTKRNALEKERNDLRRQISELEQTVAKQSTAPDDRRHVVQESQREETLVSSADPRHPRPLYAQDTQEAYDYLEESRFATNLSDKDTKYKKVQQASNSSSKRVSTPSGKSSSPGFVNAQAHKPMTYGMNSSGQKRRHSQDKEPVKRKGSTGGRVVNGYEAERQKRVKPNESSQAEYRPPNPSAPPSVPGSSYGSRARVTRSGTAQMNSRFAQELSKGQGGAGGQR